MRHGYAIVLLVLTACSDTSQPGLAPADASTDRTSGTNDAAADGTAPGDSAPAPDDASDAGDGRAGHSPNDQPSDPGVIKCGGQSCTTATHYCCVDTGDGGTAQCLDNGVSSCGGLRQACKEAADCPNANVCCINPMDASFIADNTQCVVACDTNGIQVCRTDAECKNAMPCVGQLCNGVWIQTCGHPPESACQ